MRDIFCEKLRTARREIGKTQEQVAEEVGISRNIYAFYERGLRKPSLQTFASICLVLEKSAEELLCDGEYIPYLSKEKRERMRMMDEPKLLMILNILQAIYKS